MHWKLPSSCIHVAVVLMYWELPQVGAAACVCLDLICPCPHAHCPLPCLTQAASLAAARAPSAGSSLAGLEGSMADLSLSGMSSSSGGGGGAGGGGSGGSTPEWYCCAYLAPEGSFCARANTLQGFADVNRCGVWGSAGLPIALVAQPVLLCCCPAPHYTGGERGQSLRPPGFRQMPVPPPHPHATTTPPPEQGCHHAAERAAGAAGRAQPLLR